MSKRIPLVFGILILAWLAACTPTPTNNPTQIEPSSDPVTPSVPVVEPDGETVPDDAGPLTLRIWVPPAFSPDPASEAGALLKARLDEFVLLHPGVRVTVRIKAETGSGGMFNALSATANAVPDALPDLILAPRLELERLAGAGLVGYFDRTGEGWFDFTTSLAILDGNVIGLPFAGDALAMLFRPDIVEEPPADWQDVLALDTPFIFAAGDSQGLFTLAQYQANGGEFQAEESLYTIDPISMVNVFKFFREARETDVFPSWITALSDQTEVYESLLSGRTRIGIAWISEYLSDPDSNLEATSLPTHGGVPFTFATGWLWALGNPDSRHAALNIELARFLTDSGFMADWTFAAGYLPMRPDALAGWPQSARTDIAGEIVVTAAPIPSLAIIEGSGPLIQQALIDLWSGEISLMDAAESVTP